MKKVLNLALGSALGLIAICALTGCGNVDASRKNIDFKEYINVIDEDQFEEEYEKLMGTLTTTNKSFTYEEYEYYTENETFNNNVSSIENYEYSTYKFDFNNEILLKNEEEYYNSKSVKRERIVEASTKTQTQKDGNSYILFDLNNKYYTETSYDSIPDDFFSGSGNYYGNYKFTYFDVDKYYKDGDVLTITYKLKDSNSTDTVYSDLNGKVQFYKDGDAYYGIYSLSYKETDNYDNAKDELIYLNEGFEKLNICDVKLKSLSKDDYTYGDISGLVSH